MNPNDLNALSNAALQYIYVSTGCNQIGYNIGGSVYSTEANPNYTVATTFGTVNAYVTSFGTYIAPFAPRNKLLLLCP